MYTLGDGGSAETESAIRAIIAAITSDTQLRPKARLSVLVALLNITFSGSSKFEVLKCEVNEYETTLNIIFAYAQE